MGVGDEFLDIAAHIFLFFGIVILFFGGIFYIGFSMYTWYDLQFNGQVPDRVHRDYCLRFCWPVILIPVALAWPAWQLWGAAKRMGHAETCCGIRLRRSKGGYDLTKGMDQEGDEEMATLVGDEDGERRESDFAV
jgi:hypothetical protein